MKMKFNIQGKYMKNTNKTQVCTPRTPYYENNNNTIIPNTQYTIHSSRSDDNATIDAKASSTPALAGSSSKTYSEICKSIESGKITAAKSILANAHDLFRIDVSIRSDSVTRAKRNSVNISILEKSGGDFVHFTCNLAPADRLRELTHNTNYPEFFNNVKEFAQHLNCEAGKLKLKQDGKFRHRKLVVPKMAAFLLMEQDADTPTVMVQIGDETFNINTYHYTGKYAEIFPFKGFWQRSDSEEEIEL